MLLTLQPYRLLATALLFLVFTTAPLAEALAQVKSPAFAPFFSNRAQSAEQQRIETIDNRLENIFEPEAGYERHSYDDYADPRRRAKARPLPYDPSTSSPIPATFPSASIEKSALEELYAGRIVEDLQQFGYDMFGTKTFFLEPTTPLYEPRTAYRTRFGDDPLRQTQQDRTRPHMPMGAVQDNFILGSGDQLEITFTGQRTDRDLYIINNEGILIIPDFPPIPAAGRSIAQVRLSLEAAAHNLYNTQAYLSLSSVRQIGILVVGHVKHPGRQSLTVFHTVLDALMEAGGVEKTGSLRQIKLVRNGRSTIIDLYALLNHGATNMDLNLRDGDRLIIPPIGPTVAIAGEVKRPGIYEIQQELSGMYYNSANTSEKLSLNTMLEMGGGVLSPGQNRFLKLDLTGDGRETVDEMHDAFAPSFGDGSILMVSKGKEKRSGTVELAGHTRKPGIHALDEAKTLSALIPDDTVLGPDAYPLIGVIERWDEKQLSSKLISYPLRLVLNKKYDIRLHDGDVVHLFSHQQIGSLSDDITAALEGKKTIRQLHAERRRLMGEGSFSPDGEENDESTLPYIENEALNAFLSERMAFIRGAVRRPGAYPVAEGATLETLLAVAGGVALEANTSNIEVTSGINDTDTNRIAVDITQTNPANIVIAAGDAVRVNQKFNKIADNSVLIIGEVKNPGRYDLLPGDKLSDLMIRAGGLTNQAYPEGAIFSRESERRAEENRFKSQARELERSISMALNGAEEKGIEKTKLLEARALAKELREAEGVGRITVEADPAALNADPQLDILLEAGDRIFVPKRTLAVRVSGEVLSPAALQFRRDKDASDYINEAGGFTFHADKDRAFVLYPNGSAQPLQVSAWNYNPAMIPPGSTIVVPFDPEPFDFIDSARDISNILSNLAITAIFIDDIRDD